MIRSLWLIISTLAIANVLAIGGFVGWLAAGDRLSAARLHEIRDVLKETNQQEQARKEREQKEREAEAARQEALSMIGTPPANVSQRMKIISEHEEAQAIREERFERHAQNLLRDLARREAAFTAERDRFNEEKQAWEAMRSELVALQSSEQFAKAVQLYASMKPAEVRAMMQSLIDGGEIGRVVAYLDAMSPRKSSKVLSEFGKGDPALAADLLERLRKLGSEVQLAEGVVNE